MVQSVEPVWFVNVPLGQVVGRVVRVGQNEPTGQIPNIVRHAALEHIGCEAGDPMLHQ